MNGPTHGGVVCGCGRIMRVKKNSITVEELLEDGRPYKLWDADLFFCEECGVEIITGFGRQWPHLPSAVHGGTMTLTLGSLLTFILTLAIVGFIVWILVTYIPMPDIIKRVFIAIVAIVMLLWLLRFLGVVT